MKKSTSVLSLLFLLFSFQGFAGIKFIENKTWKEVLALAKQKNKLIFLDAYATWCGPCKYLQKNVFTDDEVGDYYNANFINVKMDMEAGEGIALAEKLNVASYPTLFFINGDGKVVHKTVGAMESEDFITLGKKAINPETQYYTIKEKAVLGRIAPAIFDAWIHDANDMEDEDVESIIRQYLSNTSHPMMEKSMLEIMMNHAKFLTRSQLDLLYKNRQKAAGILGESLADYDEALLTLACNHAEKQATAGSVPDFEKYRSIVSAYNSGQAGLKTQLFKVEYYASAENTTKTMEALNSLFDVYRHTMSVEDMSLSVINATNEIYNSNRMEEWIRKVNAFQIKAAEEDMTYYKDMALLTMYYRMENKEKTEYYIKRIKSDENAPDAIVRIAESLGDDE